MGEKRYKMEGHNVTGDGVVERGPGDSSWVCESDLLL